jgi:hypothetical protein
MSLFTHTYSYLGYLLFQLGTHSTLFMDVQGPSQSTRFPENVQNAPHALAEKVKFRRWKGADVESDGSSRIGDTRSAMARIHGTSTALETESGEVQRRKGGQNANEDVENGLVDKEEEEEGQEPEMNLPTTLCIMVSSMFRAGGGGVSYPAKQARD